MRTVAFANGDRMPLLGLGTWQSAPGEVGAAVREAIRLGYRHIDCASGYANEPEVGAAIRGAIDADDVSREELWITSKLWCNAHGQENVEAALRRTLADLGLAWLDLYLIHWPGPLRDKSVASWLALEQLHAAGLAKAIGVSNFEPEHLEQVLEAGSVVPAINQVELHPAFQQRELRAFQEPLGIITEAWGPLGQGKYELSELPGLTEIAEAHGKSIQQIVLRWHLQEGLVVFPKTVRKERLVENFSVFDFVLSEQEMAALVAMDADRRVGTHPRDGNW